jgi:2'-5' RNA ligase
MRTFIAIDLEPAVRQPLVQFLRALPNHDGVKWVGPSQLHVTLKFLGEITDSKLVEICRLAEEVSRQVDPFSIRVQGMGVFPAPRNPRVLWCGVEDSAGGCGRWVSLADPLLTELNFKPETRAFTPHVTLGRSRSTAGGRVLRDVLEGATLPETPEMTASQVVVYESQLGPGGPRYKALATIPLG